MTMKFELPEQMVAVIGNALGAQPYNVVAPVIAELQRQIDAQGQAPHQAPPAQDEDIEVKEAA